jgi:hypothetical protein
MGMTNDKMISLRLMAILKIAGGAIHMAISGIKYHKIGL